MNSNSSNRAVGKSTSLPWLWILCLYALSIVLVAIGVAWSVRSAIGEGPWLSDKAKRSVLFLAELPGLTLKAYSQIKSDYLGTPGALLVEKNSVQKSNWLHQFPSREDTGYLLFSGVSPSAKHSVVQLIRISDGKVIATWDPDWKSIYPALSQERTDLLPSKPSELRAVHPLLMDNGDIIANISGTALARFSPCSSKPVWLLNEEIHHSVEFSEDRKNIWVPSTAKDGFADSPSLRQRTRDDALAVVSPEGKLLHRISLSKILRNNGFFPQMLGNYRDDPIHLNEIKPAQKNGPYWNRGDLLISARNLSTIFLYRPSTGKVIWHQTGPWINQHSADFLDDHRISVFNNNVITNIPGGQLFYNDMQTNGVYVYDFKSKTFSQPYSKLLAEFKPRTVPQGRAQILPDGGLFFEETMNGRLLRFSKDKLLWSYINSYDKNHLGILAWSRYFTAEDARTPLKELAKRKCQKAN